MLFGIGIAILLKGRSTRSGSRSRRPGTVLLTRTFIVSTVVGTVVTVIAAPVPARRSGPRGADRGVARGPGSTRALAPVPISSGVVVLALGVAPLLYGLFGSWRMRSSSSGSVALTFIGVAMLTPLIARPVAAGIGSPIRRTGVPGKLSG